MRVGAGVRPGTHVNQAQVRSATDDPVSNVATAEVVLTADPLLDESGLVIVGEDDPSTGSGQAKRYDRFRDRIMFPIRNVKGEVIGFGGRVLGDEKPKYLNSPETPVFHKGRELYGLPQAQKAIRDAGYSIVVEGYMDVVALAQNAIEYAVATLGTATTPAHEQKLLRQVDHNVYCFDGDNARRLVAFGTRLQAVVG